MIVISCAVDALCIAFAPGLAKETLPTRTLCTTVRDWQERGGSENRVATKQTCTDDSTENISFVRVFMSHAEVRNHSCLVLFYRFTGCGIQKKKKAAHMT